MTNFNSYITSFKYVRLTRYVIKLAQTKKCYITLSVHITHILSIQNELQIKMLASLFIHVTIVLHFI